MSDTLRQVLAALRTNRTQTVPEICAALKFQVMPVDVASALLSLREAGRAEYVPTKDGGCTVPMWRKAGAACR